MITEKHILLGTHYNHPKNYGFMDDLKGITIYGLDKDLIGKYENIETKFVPNGNFMKKNPNVPYGTLEIYGILKPSKQVQIEKLIDQFNKLNIEFQDLIGELDMINNMKDNTNE